MPPPKTRTTQEVSRRPVPEAQALSYSSGGVSSFELPRGWLLRELLITFSGTATITDTNNTAAKTKRGDEWALVDRIDIYANGSDLIRSISGNELFWFNVYHYGKVPKTSSNLAAGTANPTFASALRLPFWMLDSYRPIDTVLPTNDVSNLRMEIRWAAPTALNGDCSAVTGTARVTMLESFGISMVDGFDLVRQVRRPVTMTGSDPNKRIALPTGNIYRSFLIEMVNASSANAAGLLTNLKLYSGKKMFVDLTETELFEIPLNKVERTVTRRGTANSRDGVYFLDLVTDGYVLEALDTWGWDELTMELAISAACTINLVPLEIIKPIAARRRVGQAA